METKYILTVPELEILLALRREAYDSETGTLTGKPRNHEAETTYFAKCEETANAKGVKEIEIRKELERRQAGYYHEAFGRGGVLPQWR